MYASIAKQDQQSHNVVESRVWAIAYSMIFYELRVMMRKRSDLVPALILGRFTGIPLASQSDARAHDGRYMVGKNLPNKILDNARGHDRFMASIDRTPRSTTDHPKGMRS